MSRGGQGRLGARLALRAVPDSSLVFALRCCVLAYIHTLVGVGLGGLISADLDEQESHRRHEVTSEEAQARDRA